MKKYYFRLGGPIFISLLLSCLFSCKQSDATLSTSQSDEVKADVLKLADLTAKDISLKGPIAWLDHFEDSPGFFMASGGSLALPDYHTANSFIKGTLVRIIPKINLNWLNIRVDPLTPQIAVMAAGFHEDVTNPFGKINPYDGYFTTIIHKTEKGRKFRDEHWSLMHGK